MERAVVLSTVLLLLAGGAVSADAAPVETRRTVTVTYDRGAVHHLSCGDCREVHARPGERAVTVELFDDVSPSGYADVAWQQVRGETGPHFFVVCGRTSEPQPVPEGRTLQLYPWSHPGTDCPGSVSTTGTMRITFHGSR